jgi:SAM-dependent methyltransferase
MSTFYTAAYRLGFHPWENLAGHPPFADTLAALIAREEDGRQPPFGRALDVGSGSGVWGVRLAERGWDVTGVELVATAVRRARKRIQAAQASMRIVRGDVATLHSAEVGTGFRLILDTGTFHGLTDPQRAAMGREITAVAAADATLLLDIFAPGRRGPLPRGATRADVESAFPAWRIADVVVADSEPDAIAVKLNFDEHWYRLRRN